MPPITVVVPAGASTGVHEAVELRDGDKKRYFGKGVRMVRSMPLMGRSSMPSAAWMPKRLSSPSTAPQQGAARCQCHPRRIVRSRQGGRHASGLALYRYVGGSSARLLPVPMMNIVNGGVHADNPIDFQEFMILPAGAENFADKH